MTPTIASQSALVHRVFHLILAGKGVLGVAQLAIGLSVALGVLERLPAVAQALVAKELSEDPGDFLAGRILAAVDAFPESQSTFFALYFSAHGLLHVAVVALLLLGRVWAYPFAVLVLAAFIVYQTYEWFSVGGALLPLLSVIDLVVICLTVLEWRGRSRRQPEG